MDNLIYHNNIVDNNLYNASDVGSITWDNAYPSGGNYWSDYTGVDHYSGSNQNQPGSDGIGDTPYYVAGGVARDNYPLMQPWEEPTEKFINIEAAKCSVVESEGNELAIVGAPGHTINIIVPANAIFPGGLRDNPPTDTIGPATISDAIDADGIKRYEVYFTSTGTYTIAVIDTITNLVASVDIEVEEKAVWFDLSRIVIIGDMVYIRGTANAGTTVDVFIDNELYASLNNLVIHDFRINQICHHPKLDHIYIG